MTTIVTRAGLGSPLPSATVDANFTNLNTDKLELGSTFSSGTANSILYLNGSKVLTTGSALTFSGSQLSVTTTGDTSTLIRTTGATNAASLILQTGNSTASGKYAYARFVNDDSTTVDWRVGTYGTNSFTFHNATSTNNLMSLSTEGGLTVFAQANAATVFNENGVDADFRVEGDTQTHLLFADASTDRVGIATNAPAQTLDVSGTFQVARPFNSGITLARFYHTTYTGGAQVYDIAHFMSADAPNIRISEYDSGSAAIVGELTLSGGDANVQVIGSTGPMLFGVGRAVGTAGYLTTGERLRLGSTESVFNEQSADIDFRVESDTNTHMLFVDAGNNKVSVGTSLTPTAPADFRAYLGVHTSHRVISAISEIYNSGNGRTFTITGGGNGSSAYLSFSAMNHNGTREETYYFYNNGGNWTATAATSQTAGTPPTVTVSGSGTATVTVQIVGAGTNPSFYNGGFMNYEFYEAYVSIA